MRPKSTPAPPEAARKKQKQASKDNSSSSKEVGDVNKILDLSNLEVELSAAQREEAAAVTWHNIKVNFDNWASVVLRNEYLGKVIQKSKDKVYFAASMYTTLLATGLCKSGSQASDVVAQAMKKTSRGGQQRNYGSRTVRGWMNVYESSRHGILPVRKVHEGNTARWLLFGHPALQDKAVEWVRAHAKKRGKANMKIKDFWKYVNEDLLCVRDPENSLSDMPISMSSARKWLLRLGFSVQNHQKGTFKDGHDDIEVIEYRQNVYLPQMEAWRKQALLPQDFQDENGDYTRDLKTALSSALTRVNAAGYDHVLIIHSHDECSYNSNEAEGSHWGLRGDQAITSKSRGALIMVSDWCNICGGFLSLTDAQFEKAKGEHSYTGPQMSRVALELGGDTPWFDNTQLLAQVGGFYQLAYYTSRYVWKAPFVRHVCVYDNAPSHRKRAPNALSAYKMRKGPGVKCASVPEMRDTEYYDEKKDAMVNQKLVHNTHAHGARTIKGAMQVGYERGLWDKEGKVEAPEVEDSSDKKKKSKKRKMKMRSVGLPQK